MKYTSTLIASLLVLAGAVVAAPKSNLKLAAVPPGTAWLVQGQLEDLNSWESFPEIYDSLSKTSVGQVIGDAVTAIGGNSLNATSEVERVTVFGLEGSDVVVMLESKWPLAQLEESLQSRARVVEQAGAKVYALPAGSGGVPLFASVAEGKVWLGQKGTAVGQVAEYLGKEQPVNDLYKKFAKQTKGGEGAMLSLLSQDMQALIGVVPELAMLMQANGLALHLGKPVGSKMPLKLLADTPNEESAFNLMQILSGLQTMISFRADSDPMWGSLAQTLKMKQEGSQVLLETITENKMILDLLKTAFRELQRKGGW